MEDQRFDTLAERLAGPMSRRTMVKMLAAATVGGLFAGRGTGSTFADNSDCAHFCNDVFGPGPDRGACKSAAAHGTGLCHTPCGPGGSGGQLCGGPDYASTTCCGAGFTCQAGTCVQECSGKATGCTTGP